MSSFGARLKREREQRKISLDDISASTKIGTRLLRALEDDHFEQLPGGIFNKGFVRAYARHVGLDEDQTVADFLEASGVTSPIAPPDKRPVIEAPPERAGAESTNVPWGILAALLLVVAFGFAAWAYYSRERRASAEGLQTPAVQGPGRVITGKPETSPDPYVVANPSVHVVTGLGPATPALNQAEPHPGMFTVTIKAREDCQVSIIADGKQVLQETLSAPAEKSVNANNEIVLRGGNIGALDIFFNGEKIATQGAGGQVRSLTFGPDGLEVKSQSPPSPQPSAQH